MKQINPPITANHSLFPKLICMLLKGNCLKQDKVIFTPRNVVNLFTVYELDTWFMRFKLVFYSCLELLS